MTRERRAVFRSPDGRVRSLLLWEDIPEQKVAEALGWSWGTTMRPPSVEPAWSWSALEGFSTCARRHMAVRVLKLVADTPGPALVEGRVVHEDMARAVRGEAAPPEAYAWTMPFIEKVRARGRVQVEQMAALTADFQPTGKWSKDVSLRVVYDVLVRYDPYAIVVDWKTGRVRDDTGQLMLQASALLLGVDPPRAVTASFVWLDARQVTTVTVTQGMAVDFMIDLRRNRLPPLFEALAGKDNAKSYDAYPPTRGWACRWCPLVECEHNAAS